MYVSLWILVKVKSDKNVGYILSYLICFTYYKNCECTVDLYRFFESRTTNISLHINITRIYMQVVNFIFFFIDINYCVGFFFEHHVNRHNH
jgi:hypothetical protein